MISASLARRAASAPLLFVFALIGVACHGGGLQAQNQPADAMGAPGEAAVDAKSLCVSSACGQATVLVTIPDAENILFTPSGRLIVSGGENVYEITGSLDDGFTATPIANQTCNFTGLALHADHLYAACGDGRLFAGALTGPLKLSPIFTMTGMCLPNGMATGADGNLYVADGPVSAGSNCLPPDPKIVRLNLDPADPMHVVSQATWLPGSALGGLALNLNNQVSFPTGLQADGRRFYGSAGGSIYSVDLNADGSPGPVKPLYFTPTVWDDLGLVPGGLLLADFAQGSIALISREGKLLQQTDALTFSFPSSARLARPPLFQPDDILVTEKGILQEMSSPIGNRLTLFRRKAS